MAWLACTPVIACVAIQIMFCLFISAGQCQTVFCIYYSSVAAMLNWPACGSDLEHYEMKKYDKWGPRL